MLDQSFVVNLVSPPGPRGGETAQAAWPHPDHNEPSPCRWHPQAGWPYHSHDEPSPGLSPRDLGRLAAVRPHSPFPSRSRPPSGRRPVTGQPRPGPVSTLPPIFPPSPAPPPRRMPEGGPDWPCWVTSGNRLGLAGILTGAPTSSAQWTPLGAYRRPGECCPVSGKPRRQPSLLLTGTLAVPKGTR